MKDFKVLFPSGYIINDLNNDNIDVNVVFKNGQVFFATFFTIRNIASLMEKEKSGFFWADSMIIVENMEKKTLRKAIGQIIEQRLFEALFSHIGNFESIYGNNVAYDQIPDFSNGFEIQ